MIHTPESVNPALPKGVIQELRSKLSQYASLLLPDEPAFITATRRYTDYQGPSFAAVVVAGEEKDVQITVRIAKAHRVAFLATTCGHGDFAAMADIHGGIQLNLSRLNKVQISNDGDRATIGAGLMIKDLNDRLWDAGKVTVTGMCETVGIGLWLGGGHGLLQGQFGLAADQIVEARLVTAEGDVVVASETSNSDLLWALKGAGQNFGVVVEMTIRVYDAKPYETWTHESHIFSEDQLENVFETMNDMLKTQGPTDNIFTLFKKIPEIDPVKSVILIVAMYVNTPESTHLQQFTATLHRLPHIDLTTGTTPYPSTPQIVGVDASGPMSQKGLTYRRAALDLVSHDIPSTREAYRLFDATVRHTPQFAAHTAVMFEQYATHAVEAVAPESTAVPWRTDRLLVTPFVWYEPDPTLDATAIEFATAVRNVLGEGSGRPQQPHTYVNYANGEEDLRALLGYEDWRWEKLTALKRKYDPDGLFSYFAGIPVDGGREGKV